jgi:hypothetical protein
LENLLKDKSDVYKAVDIEKQRATEQNRVSELEIRRLKETMLSLESAISQKDVQIENREKAIFNLRSELQDKDDELDIQIEQCLEAENRTASLKEERDRLSSLYEELKAKNETEQNGQRDSQRIARTALEGMEKAEQERREAEEQLDIVKLKVTRMKKEYNDLLDKLAVANQKQVKLTTKLSKMDEQQSRMNELSRQVSTPSAYVRRCEEYEHKIVRLHAKEKELIQELVKARESDGQCDKLRKSHSLEMEGVLLQLKYFKDVADREKGYKEDLLVMKRYFTLKINGYETFNELDMAILRKHGISAPKPRKSRRPRFLSIIYFVLATVRLRRRVAIMENRKKTKTQLSKLKRTIKSMK